MLGNYLRTHRHDGPQLARRGIVRNTQGEDMHFVMKTKLELVDEATGVVIAARGFAESWQRSFAFFDPRSDATSHGDDRSFYVIGDKIYGDKPIDPSKSNRKPFLGYRFRAAAIAG